MKKSIALLLSILFACTILTSCDESLLPQTLKEKIVKNVSENISNTTPEHYKGTWMRYNRYNNNSISYTFSIDNIRMIVRANGYTIPPIDIPINKWEPVKNFNEASKSNYPDGYKLWIKEEWMFLFRHYEDNDRILIRVIGDEDVVHKVRM